MYEGIFGVLCFGVSFVSCRRMMSGLNSRVSSVSSLILLLIPFMLNWIIVRGLLWLGFVCGLCVIVGVGWGRRRGG